MKKKAKASESDDDMRAEYDFSKMKFIGRGIYAKAYRSGTNLVLLDSDVRKAFPDDKSINETLRAVAKAQRQAKRAKKSQPRKSASRSRRVA
jgi:hypothetical protein